MTVDHNLPAVTSDSLTAIPVTQTMDHDGVMVSHGSVPVTQHAVAADHPIVTLNSPRTDSVALTVTVDRELAPDTVVKHLLCSYCGKDFVSKFHTSKTCEALTS